MIGLVLGLACGVCEVFLLVLLIRGIAAGNLRVWILPAKMGALALFFVPCGLLWPDQLHIAGIAAAGFLIVGGAAASFGNILRRRNDAHPDSDKVAK